MMSKHTPGPWQYNAKLSGSENHRGFSICNEHGWALADVQPADEDGIEGEFNASLIATAPDLLAVLQELIDIEGPQPGTVAWADKARAAIAKATGENNDQD
jgi:hypothetical protein